MLGQESGDSTIGHAEMEHGSCIARSSDTIAASFTGDDAGRAARGRQCKHSNEACATSPALAGARCRPWWQAIVHDETGHPLTAPCLRSDALLAAQHAGGGLPRLARCSWRVSGLSHQVCEKRHLTWDGLCKAGEQLIRGTSSCQSSGRHCLLSG